jgi:hypothetical protein
MTWSRPVGAATPIRGIYRAPPPTLYSLLRAGCTCIELWVLPHASSVASLARLSSVSSLLFYNTDYQMSAHYMGSREPQILGSGNWSPAAQSMFRAGGSSNLSSGPANDSFEPSPPISSSRPRRGGSFVTRLPKRDNHRTHGANPEGRRRSSRISSLRTDASSNGSQASTLPTTSTPFTRLPSVRSGANLLSRRRHEQVQGPSEDNSLSFFRCPNDSSLSSTLNATLATPELHGPPDVFSAQLNPLPAHVGNAENYYFPPPEGGQYMSAAEDVEMVPLGYEIILADPLSEARSMPPGPLDAQGYAFGCETFSSDTVCVLSNCADFPR